MEQGFRKSGWALKKLASAALVALGEALYIGTSSLPLSVAGSVLFGCGSAGFGLACRAVLVSVTPPQRHGRMLATWRALQFGCDIAPAACTGILVGAIGLRAVLVLAPVLALAAATCALTAADAAMNDRANRVLMS